MSIEKAYNEWSAQYDINQNKTRDAEANALRKTLQPLSLDKVLEIGCGTGKNTVWLAQHCKHVTAVDFSEGMLQKAKEKVKYSNVSFVQADLLQPWAFEKDGYGLVVFSLVLEHIEHLEPVFEKAQAVLRPGGYIYVGELHPFKQYSGSKARYEKEGSNEVVQCYTHHISQFTKAAAGAGLQLAHLDEFFDDEAAPMPRILTLLFQKK